MKRFLPVNKNFFTKIAATANSTSVSFSFKNLFTCIVAMVCVHIIYAQQTKTPQQETDYKKTITDRSAKILNTLGLTDSGVYDKVLDQIANQYYNLNAIQEKNTAAIADIKKQSPDKIVQEEALQKQAEKKSSQLLQLHTDFIALLKRSLSDDQLEKVKDEMTYRVFPITYAAYQDMLPNLTTEQKEKIYNWLKEARELAMDEGSSDDKHKVFGKYKGRINNYLSAAGYELKKETDAWQARIKQREEQKKSQ
jgi:hypothetical protein